MKGLHITILSTLFMITVFSCSTKTKPKDWFATEQEEKKELLLIAPYVLPLPNKEDVSLTEWYRGTDSIKQRQESLLQSNEAVFNAYTVDSKDNTFFYLVSMRDFTSLYEHYKLYGGMYTKKGAQIDSLTELFISPRLKKEELDLKGKELFDQIVSERNIGSYYERKDYVEWPYKGLVYDVKQKMWVMTPENEMYFLQEARDSVEVANRKRAEEIKRSKTNSL